MEDTRQLDGGDVEKDRDQEANRGPSVGYGQPLETGRDAGNQIADVRPVNRSHIRRILKLYLCLVLLVHVLYLAPKTLSFYSDILENFLHKFWVTPVTSNVSNP